MNKFSKILLVIASIFTFNLIGCKKNNVENVEQKFLANDCVDYFYDLED